MKTICIDFDGVLNTYTGWQGDTTFADVRAGAKEFMAALAADGWQVIVFTSRAPGPVAAWLTQQGIPFERVTTVKPPAVAYVDDRAICFMGDFHTTLGSIREFKPFWEGQ